MKGIGLGEMRELGVELGDIVEGNVVMLIISLTVSLTDVMRYVWNVLNFTLMLFDNDILLSSGFSEVLTEKNS